MLSNDQPIWTIENKKEERFLRKRPADFDFSKYTEKELRELITTMRSIMRRANGVGLSANQVGLDIQLFVAGIPQQKGKPKFYAIFNPKIEKPSKEHIAMEEGCLSVPNMWGVVSRPKEIIITGFDKHKKPIRIRATGLLARVFQHEVDHLNGIVFIDKAQSVYTRTEEIKEEIL